MSYVVDGKVRGETWIEARGIKHRLVFSVNQIKQEPLVKDIRSRSRIRTGTRVTIFWPDKVDCDEIAGLLNQFVWVNPHLTLLLTVNDKTALRCGATKPNWTKYRACDATSARWYSLEQFERYAGALIDRDQQQKPKKGTRRDKITVREFARSPCCARAKRGRLYCHAHESRPRQLWSLRPRQLGAPMQGDLGDDSRAVPDPHGSRPVELVTLRWGAIDFPHGQIL